MNAFQSAVKLYRALANPTYCNHGNVEGEVNLSLNIIAQIDALKNQNLVTDLQIDGHSRVSADLTQFLNKNIEITFAPPSGQGVEGYFVEKLDDLLKRKEHCEKVPSSFYLSSVDILVPDDAFELLEAYKKAAHLTQLLTKISEFQFTDTISFVKPMRLDIGKLFTKNDLEKSTLTRVDSLAAELLSETPDHHTERRQEIFVNTLFDYLKSIDLESRLGYLIVHLDGIYEHYRKDYEIYAKDFSHRKLVAELDAKKTEYVERLQKAVNDISTKILSIPVAYGLIAGQLKTSGHMNNHIVMIGALVFALLMLLLITGQLMALHQTSNEIKSFKKSYEGLLNKTEYAHKFNPLTIKLFVQQFTMWFVVAIVILVCYLTAKLYSAYTDPTIFEIVLTKFEYYKAGLLH